MKKTGRRTVTTRHHTSAPRLRSTRIDDQPGRHHTSTQQADAKDRSHHSNNHAGPKAAPRLPEDEPASAEPPKHSTSPPVRWTSKARTQEAKGHKSAANTRSREGSRVSPGEPGRRSRNTRFDDAFKKDAAPTGVTIVGPGWPPRQSFCPTKSPKPSRPPNKDRHKPPPTSAASRPPESRGSKNRYNTTPHVSPDAALHTDRRPTRSTPHLNATSGGERPEPLLQLPRRPQNRGLAEDEPASAEPPTHSTSCEYA
jgi:hypothetical protein